MKAHLRLLRDVKLLEIGAGTTKVRGDQWHELLGIDAVRMD